MIEPQTRITRTYFAGLNTSKFAEALVGEDVLISYADVIRRPGVWAREILPRLERRAYRSVILDSGAFTELTTPGFHVDVHEYAAFARKHLHLFTWVANLDDIRGDLERSNENLAILEAAGVPAVPVFHQGEPWSELERLCARYGRIGLGFQRENGRIVAGAREWLRDALARIPAEVKVHGFGMTRFANRYGAEHARPLDTVDSTTWIAEYRALAKTDGPHRMEAGSYGAAVMLALGDRGRIDLVLASYTDAAHFESQGAENCAITAGARGQARTVCRRLALHTRRLVVRWIEVAA